MAAEFGDIESRAAHLQDGIAKFAAADFSSQERSLKQTLNLASTANKETIDFLVDREKQQWLETAAQLTPKTPIELAGKIIKPFKDNYTVVMMDSSGGIVAGVSRRNDDEDKFKFALSKAIVAIHLLKGEYYWGLGNSGNLLYLNAIGIKPLEEIFMGTLTDPPFVKLGDQSFSLGSAGCDVKLEVLNEILDLGTDEEGKMIRPGKNTQAGRFDNLFCDVTASNIGRTEPPNSYLAPRWLLELYWGN